MAAPKNYSIKHFMQGEWHYSNKMTKEKADKEFNRYGESMPVEMVEHNGVFGSIIKQNKQTLLKQTKGIRANHVQRVESLYRAIGACDKKIAELEKDLGINQG